MADRVAASIVIGGIIPASDYAELAQIIANECLSIDWEGEPFAPEHRTRGNPLSLYAHEIAGGRFEELEVWCARKQLHFTRWSGAYPGQWGAERIVFTGEGEPRIYAVDEDDHVVLNRETIEKLGSIEAILAYFDYADAALPSLVVASE